MVETDGLVEDELSGAATVSEFGVVSAPGGLSDTFASGIDGADGSLAGIAFPTLAGRNK
jgi:hypothetical protein